MQVTNINGSPNQNTSLRNYAIPGDVYDVTRVWFERRGFSKSAAELLSGALISTTIDNEGSKIDVLEILKIYQDSTDAEMQQLTAYLLNIARVPTSYIGYEAPMASNQVFARLVI
jgi:hypothetical protein